MSRDWVVEDDTLQPESCYPGRMPLIFVQPIVIAGHLSVSKPLNDWRSREATAIEQVHPAPSSSEFQPFTISPEFRPVWTPSS
jgi:hypothetical protein